MTTPHIVSINVGLPQTISVGSDTLRTAIVKKPVSGPVFMGETGLEGDGPADLRFHGGADKAVCVYSSEYYPAWGEFLGRSLAYGAFGENLSLGGMDDTGAVLGAVYKLGEAEIQISQPRIPCHKVSKIFNCPEMVEAMLSRRATGFYVRVLKTGKVASGDALTLLSRTDEGISIHEANELMFGENPDRERCETVLKQDYIAKAWLKDFQSRREKKEKVR